MFDPRHATEGLTDLEPVGVKSHVKNLDGQANGELTSCTYGAGNEDDFVLHIEPAHPRCPFPVNLKEVYGTVHRHLAPLFPSGVVVEIVPPAADWVIQHIVFVAKGAMQHWSFDEDAVSAALPAMMRDLDKIVYAERARRLGRKHLVL
jgi:hypothetical protein